MKQNCVGIDNLPPEVVQQVLGHLGNPDLLNCRLVSTFFKTQTDQVIGFKNQDEDDPNLLWNPQHKTELKCKPDENFIVKVLPGTTVIKTQKQINKFLKYASKVTSSSQSPFQNGALVYRAASRMRVQFLCSTRDFLILFDRPVDGLTNLLSLYGQHLTSFVFDCKNQSFHQFLTVKELKSILECLPNLKFLGVNVPFKLGLIPPSEPVANDEEIQAIKTDLPALPHLEAISLGLAISAYCYRGYGDGILALEELLGAYGNQIKMLTLGGTGAIIDTDDSYLRVFLETEPDKQISFEALENLKIFSCVAGFDILQVIAVCPYSQWNLKRLSLQLKRCHCSDSKLFTCPLPSWSRSIPNIVMLLMTRFAQSLEEMYLECEEREVDVLHWIYPCRYEWRESKEEEREKYVNGTQVKCPQIKKLWLPANRIGTQMMKIILERCESSLEELTFLRGELNVDYSIVLQDIWFHCPALKKVAVLKNLDFYDYLYKERHRT